MKNLLLFILALVSSACAEMPSAAQTAHDAIRDAALVCDHPDVLPKNVRADAVKVCEDLKKSAEVAKAAAKEVLALAKEVSK